MQLADFICESYSTDRRQRADALSTFNAVVKHITSGRAQKQDDAIIVRVGDINPDHGSLLVAVTGGEQASSLGEVAASFGIYDGSPIIVLAVPDIHDPNIEMELSRGRSSFVHEFQHYLDHQRSDGRIRSSANANNVAEYYNNDAEFNAHYQEGLDKLYRMASRESWIKQLSDFNEFFQFAKNAAFNKRFIASLNPQNMRKLNRRLYQELRY